MQQRNARGLRQTLNTCGQTQVSAQKWVTTQTAKLGSPCISQNHPRLPLLSGEYLWSVYVLDDSGIQVLDMAELIQPFTVLNQKHREFGVAWLEHEWVLVE